MLEPKKARTIQEKGLDLRKGKLTRKDGISIYLTDLVLNSVK